METLSELRVVFVSHGVVICFYSEGRLALAGLLWFDRWWASIALRLQPCGQGMREQLIPCQLCLSFFKAELEYQTLFLGCYVLAL